MKIMQIQNFSETAFLCLVEIAPQTTTQLIVNVSPDGSIDFGPINSEFTNLPGFARMKEELQKYANGDVLVMEVEYNVTEENLPVGL